MLVPRFSIGWLLGLTAFASVFFWIARQAAFGSSWAIAVTTSLALLVTVLIGFAATFLAAYSLAWFTRMLHPPKRTENPFVVPGHYPPQEVPQQPYGGTEQ